MILFLVKSTFCLALLYAFYVLFLENQKIHRFNRFYLLGILFLSLIIPNIILYVESSLVFVPKAFKNPSSTFQFLNHILFIYALITIVLLVKFIAILTATFRRINSNTKIVRDNHTVVLLEDKVLPHTFLNYVFLNKTDYEKGTIQDELLAHELTHVTEKHTLDILCIEIIQILFWCNPILYFVKKSIKLNHEYLADESVINTFTNRAKYQHILLHIVSWNNAYGLTSNINYSLTKRRFQMMTKKSSRLTKSSAKFAIIPLLLLSFYLFSNTSIQSEKEHHTDRTVTSEDNHINPNNLKHEHVVGSHEGEKQEALHRD